MALTPWLLEKINYFWLACYISKFYQPFPDICFIEYVTLSINYALDIANVLGPTCHGFVDN